VNGGYQVCPLPVTRVSPLLTFWTILFSLLFLGNWGAKWTYFPFTSIVGKIRPECLLFEKQAVYCELYRVQD